MIRYIIGVLVLIFGSLAAMYFLIGVPQIYSEEFKELPIPHSFGDANRSIPEISIAAFYFVPQNKTADVVENWKEILESSLQKLKMFHNTQFLGRSRITYAIYPEPVIGLKEGIKYDSESTQNGNPQALRNVSEELQVRVFDAGGDLSLSDFKPFREGAYPVLAIVYEGVGAVGGVIYESEFEIASDIATRLRLPEASIFIVDVEAADGFFLINRRFFDGPEYIHLGPTLFAHEFYHTIGIPDAYKIPSEIPTSADIMGLGRFKQLEETYIDKKTLGKMGL